MPRSLPIAFALSFLFHVAVIGAFWVFVPKSDTDRSTPLLSNMIEVGISSPPGGEIASSSVSAHFKTSSDCGSCLQPPSTAPLREVVGSEAGVTRKHPSFKMSTRRGKGAFTPSGEPGVPYETALAGWLDRHKVYPRQATKRGVEGKVSIKITIDRDGNVKDFEIVQSSGYDILDASVEEMVKTASPFPPVPKNYDGSEFAFIAPVRFRLE